eukprot:SAG11_NODE_830_length_6956_cov_11.233484_5_plen_89_part_00
MAAADALPGGCAEAAVWSIIPPNGAALREGQLAASVRATEPIDDAESGDVVRPTPSPVSGFSVSPFDTTGRRVSAFVRHERELSRRAF